MEVLHTAGANTGVLHTTGGNMRVLHTMLRVGNLQRSIDFYTRALGMTLLRTTDRPEQKRRRRRLIGRCARVAAAGGTVTRPPGPVKGGTTVIAFVEDPDHYKIELIETGSG